LNISKNCKKIFLTASAELTCVEHNPVVINEAYQYSTALLTRSRKFGNFSTVAPKLFACTPSLTTTDLSNNPRWP